MSRKHPGMRLTDGRDASALLTDDEREQVRMIGWKMYESKPPRKRPHVVWQEPGPSRFATEREAILALYPITQLSDGTRGRWLRQEWPDVDYPERPPEVVSETLF